MNDPDSHAGNWQAWQTSEREDFFVAIQRHRRLTWRITAVCALAYAVLALIMALLLAPLLYCLAILSLDLVNLVVKTPDLAAYMGRLLAPIMDEHKPLALGHLFKVILIASLPGLLWMTWIGRRVWQVLNQSVLFNQAHTIGRPINPANLAEQQFANTLSEMAVAAIIPAPTILVLKGGANAAAAGHDMRHALILVGEDLLATLNRAQMQGVAAHLIASIADNDMQIGMRTAGILGLFSLIARLSINWQEPGALQSNRRLIRALIAPTKTNQVFIEQALADPFSSNTEPTKPAIQHTSNQLTWREWLSMPFMGPVFFSGFLGGFVNTMLLTPLVSFAWRQRKYMADASAVKLTREPNGLANALLKLNEANTALIATAWASHLCVVKPTSAPTTIVSIFPAIERRLAALVRLGATVNLPSSKGSLRAMPVWAVVLVSILGAIAGVLLLVLIPLLIIASSMLTMLFTLMPTMALHWLLRFVIAA